MALALEHGDAHVRRHLYANVRVDAPRPTAEALSISEIREHLVRAHHGECDGRAASHVRGHVCQTDYCGGALRIALRKAASAQLKSSMGLPR